MGRVPYHAVVTDWGTIREDRVGFPDDEQLPDPDDVLHRAVTVDAGVGLTWRWVCQLRVAPYSYDWLDNRGHRSPRQLTEGLDRLEIGQRVMRVFHVGGFEPNHHLTCVLDRDRLLGAVVCTYLVDPVTDSRTRLRVRVRIRYPRALPMSVLMPVLLPPGDLVMMRKQLHTIKALAERDAERVVGTASR